MTYDAALLDSLHDHSIFLFTHGHADHYNKKLFNQTHQKLYAPWPVSNNLSGKRKYSLKFLNDSMPDFSITEFKTKHRFSLKHCSYLLVWNGKRIYISGDAVSADTVCTLKDLDLVIAPAWLIRDANNRSLKIDTKKVIICHHRSQENIENRSKDKILIPTQNQTVELK
jgi:L-ascorbate metabolism protein UlaG (beta-lactamase superfamily)